MSVFVIVGQNEPLYEVDLKPQQEESAHLNQFVIHSALDMVEEQMWTAQTMYLKNVDKFNEQLISAFVTAGNVRFLLLHETRNEDGIRTFFQDVYELYIKLSLNPFYEHNTKIQSPTFDARVKALARRCL